MRRILALIVIIVAGIMVMYSCDSGSYVAKVGREKISRAEFVNALETRYSKRENYQDLSYESKVEILNSLIEKKLKLNAAYDRNLDQDSMIVQEVNMFRDRLVSSRYYEKHVIDRLVSEPTLEIYIENQRNEVKATHILLTHSDAHSTIARSKAEAKTLSEEIAKKIDQGQSFDSLAAIYSDDPAAKQGLGQSRWFQWGSMSEQFHLAVQKMEIGSIAGPIETDNAFHFVKLYDRRKNEQFSEPETVEDFYYLKRKVLQSYRDSTQIVWTKHHEILKEEYNFRLLKQPIMNLAALITEKMNEGRIDLQSFNHKEMTTPLAEWKGGVCSLSTLIKRNRERPSRILLNYRHVKALEIDINNISVIEMVIQDAINEGFEEDDFVQEQLQKFTENKLLQLLENVAINKNIAISDEEVKQFYDENPDRFKKPAEIELWEILVKDKKQADEIVLKLKRGARFGSLAQKYSEDKAMARRDGYVGFRSETARGQVSQDAFKLGPDKKIGGPVEYRNGWVVYKTGKMREESIRKFKDVKNRAKSLLRRERLIQKRQEWKKELEETYAITINEDTIRSI
jgi:parvulin-like peptidyl-prolyl isomerase